MKKRAVIKTVFFILILFLPVAAARGQDKGREKRMGYCFDTGFDSTGNLLFVAGGDAGLHVFEISEGNFELVTTINDGGYYRNLKVKEGRVYIANYNKGLMIYSIKERFPVLEWESGKNDNTCLGIFVSDGLAYLAQGKSGIEIYDVSCKDSTVLVGSFKTGSSVWDLWVYGEYAYTAESDKGMSVIDVSEPGSLKRVAGVCWDEEEPMAEIIRGEKDYVYVAAGKHGLIVIDVSNPLQPIITSKFKPDYYVWGEGLCVEKNIVYLAVGHDDVERNGLYIVDVQNPSDPQILAVCPFSDWVEGVCISGDYLYLANTWSGVRSFNVADPANPRMLDCFGPCEETPRDTLYWSAMSDEEKKAIEEFRQIRKDISSGNRFEDYSTPLKAYLSFLSALYFLDPQAFKRQYPFETEKIGLKVDKNNISSRGKYHQQLDVLRAPLPPANPQTGKVWPVYSCKKGWPGLHDTQICVYWNGKWMRCGAALGKDYWVKKISGIRENLDKFGKR